MPKRAAISPLICEPSLSEVIRTSAITTSANVSKGPKATPTRASGGVSSTSTSQDRLPPTSDAATPSPSARPG